MVSVTQEDVKIHTESGPPNRFVLEEGTTASFQNTVFHLQWNSLKTSLIKKFSCHICQDKEPPKFSLMINLPYILESNPHPFYGFRGLKNQMLIRIACGLDSRS